LERRIPSNASIVARRVLRDVVWTVLIGLLMAVGAPTAAGQSSPDDQEARRLFEAGSVAFEDAHYEAALDLFRRAHALSGRPTLLFNIGHAADRLRRDRDAVDAFEAYLRELPQAANRREVEVRLSVLRRQLVVAAAAREPIRPLQATSSEPDGSLAVSTESRRLDSDARRPRPRVWRRLGGVASLVLACAAVTVAVVLTRDRGVQHPIPGDPNLATGGVVQTLAWSGANR
jgi:hypothetical protein